MKNLKNILFFVFAFLFLLFANTLAPQNLNTMKDRFYIGAINFFTSFNLSSRQNINYYNELKFNAMQNYCWHQDYDSAHDGGFFTNKSFYDTYINGRMTRWSEGTGSNHSMFLEREKIVRPGYGQRSTYMTKYSLNQLENEITPAYGYRNRLKPAINDTWYFEHFQEQVQAINCVAGQDPGSNYIVSGLYENLEQVNMIQTPSGVINNRLWSDVKYDPNYYGYRWFVKPRMRIDAEYALNHLDQTVVLIEVINYKGETIKTLPIKCINFIKYSGGIPNYNGQYLECFYNFTDGDTVQSVLAASLAKGAPSNSKGENTGPGECKVDYKIYWPGDVTVWLDYVRVDDEWAHFLFTDSYETELQNPYNKWIFHHRIKEEVEAFKDNPSLAYFYLDEAQYNNIPCIAEVNRLVKLYSYNQTQLVPLCWLESFKELGGQKKKPTREAVLNTLYSTGAVSGYMLPDLFSYMFWTKLPANITKPDPNIYPGTVGYIKANSNETYNSELNREDWDVLYLKYHKLCAEFCKNHNITYSFDFQANSDEINYASNPPYYSWGLREPTTEEIKMSSYIGLAYGAKALLYYSYYSGTWIGIDNKHYYSWGLVDGSDTLNIIKRTSNYYTENKFDSVKKNNEKLRIIGDIMYPPGEPLKHLIWDNARTVNYANLGLPYRYLQDVVSYPRITGTNNFDMNNPDLNKYWEIGFFDDPNNPFDKYMVVVNKRAAPEINLTGDSRILQFNFIRNESGLPVFDNWELKDIATGENFVFSFSNGNNVIYPHEFAPGEGKVFRLAPVMAVGGTLIANEDIENIIFNCRGNVNTGGHDIYIRSNTSIEFNADCGITAENCSNVVFDGGSALTIHLQGKSSAKWSGITANNINNSIIINECEFNNVRDGWAITIRNSPVSVVQQSSFNLEDAEIGHNLGAVIINNNSIPSGMAFVSGNQIHIKDVTAAIAIINSAGTGGEGSVSYNNVTSGNGRVGILLSNRCQDEIWENHITGFDEGIHTYCCNVRLKNNVITSSKNNSKGVFGSQWSNLNLGWDYMYDYGGNTFTNTGNNCRNLQVDNSWFLPFRGFNNYNIALNTGSFHLYGYGPPCSLGPTYSCFNNGINSIYDLRDPDGNNYSIDESPHQCNQSQNEEIDCIVSLPLNNNDTIYKFSNNNGQFPSDAQARYIVFNMNVLKRNYDSAIILGKNLLLGYADSIYVPEVVTKLFLCSVSSDSSLPNTQALKTFYEQLIINNSQNLSLVCCANYYIQKCKVILKQYQSALSGFEDIMAHNPYSNAGLIASWDYAATILLLNDTSLGSGGYSNKEIIEKDNYSSSSLEYLIDSVRIKIFQKYDAYDKKVFSSSERNDLIKKTGNVLIDERNRQLNQITELQKEVSKKENRNTSEAKIKFEELKTLNEVIKIKKPRNAVEYTKIINDDINKIFKSTNTDNQTGTTGSPNSFELYQNYPNPFNPSTKIAFDLPQDGKVKLVIYDILGRQIKTLVDNELRTAGKYTIEFNGSNLASGIYFYRLQVEGVSKFTAVKKMVMIK